MPFILTLIAGLSTLIGYFAIYIKNNYNNLLYNSFYFASGIMLAISILDLIPTSYKYINNYYINIFTLFLVLIYIFLGISISYLINKLLPNMDNNLYHLGIFTMLVIIIHNIPEGIITYITSSNDINLGIKLCIAIMMHNIPEGISIAVPIYIATNSKRKSFIYTFISGISEFIGAILSFLVISKYINNYILGLLFSLIAGIMIYISIFELIPNGGKLNIKKMIYLVIGILIMLISILI